MKKSILRTMMVALAMIVAMNANAQGKLNPGADSKGVATTLAGLTAGSYYMNPTTKVVYYISAATGTNLTGIAVGLDDDDKTATSITINGWIHDGSYILITESVANDADTYNYNFNGLSSVETLTFAYYADDENAEYYINTIPAGAFTALTGLTSVVCESPTPATCAEGAFASAVYDEAEFIVPNGSMCAYYYSTEWENFGNLQNVDGIYYGDVNKDGDLNSNDVQTLRLWMNGDLDENVDVLEDGDMEFNGDGEWDTNDVTALRIYING